MNRSGAWLEAASLTMGLWIAGAWLFRPLQNPNDLWWHLATARAILAHHQIPRIDFFSWTAHGHRWVDHEWLFQLITYVFYQRFTANGVIVFKILLIESTFLFIWLRLRAVPSRLWRWAALALIFWAGHYGWTERADLVTALGLSYLAWACEGSLNPFENKRFATLPIVFALWANMHGGFILGLVLLALITAGAFMVRRPDALFGMLWSILCASATLINPYGIRLQISLLDGLRSLQGGFISEWQPTPWRPMEFFWLALIAFWFLFLMRPSFQWRSFFSPQGLVAIFLSWSAVHYVRNTPAFLIVSFPAAAAWAHESWEAHIPPSRFWKDSYSRVFTIAALSGGILLALFLTSRAQGGVPSDATPIDTFRFIDQLPTSIPIYNEYDLGSFWLWYFGERRPDFIDGRFHMVEGFPELYRQIEVARRGTPQNWESFLHRWGVEAVVVPYPTQTPYSAPFAEFFPRSHWALVYWDDSALVFLKRTAAEKSFIQKNEFRVVEPEAEQSWMFQRLHLSAKIRSQFHDDLRRSRAIHPESRRVRFWSTVAEAAPVN